MNGLKWRRWRSKRYDGGSGGLDLALINDGTFFMNSIDNITKRVAAVGWAKGGPVHLPDYERYVKERERENAENVNNVNV